MKKKNERLLTLDDLENLTKEELKETGILWAKALKNPQSIWLPRPFEFKDDSAKDISNWIKYFFNLRESEI